MRVRNVCKRWKKIIDAMLGRYGNNQWHWLCLETIPTNFLIDYLQSGHSPKVSVSGLKLPVAEKFNLSWVSRLNVSKTLDCVFKTFLKINLLF